MKKPTPKKATALPQGAQAGILDRLGIRLPDGHRPAAPRSFAGALPDHPAGDDLFDLLHNGHRV